MVDNLIYIPPLSESVMKWGKCLLLHEKIPTVTKDGIKYICKECKNDDDTPKDKETSKTS